MGRSFNRTEYSHLKGTSLPRKRFPPVKEGVTDSLAPVLRKENRFSKIKNGFKRDSLLSERRLEFLTFLRQRHRRGRPHHLVPVLRKNA